MSDNKDMDVPDSDLYPDKAYLLPVKIGSASGKWYEDNNTRNNTEEYVRKSIADKEVEEAKLSAQESREIRAITEKLRNQLIKDGLLDEPLVCYEQIEGILQPLKKIMDKITYAELPSRDPLRIAIEETLYLAHKAGGK